MNAHEELFAKHFIVKQKQQRYLELFNSQKGRLRAITQLDHCQDLDERNASPIPAGQQTAERICHALLAKGAAEQCYVISTNAEIDASEMRLEEALEVSVGYGFGTFLSCLPGKLGYFESGDAGERYILERK